MDLSFDTFYLISAVLCFFSMSWYIYGTSDTEGYSLGLLLICIVVSIIPLINTVVFIGTFAPMILYLEFVQRMILKLINGIDISFNWLFKTMIFKRRK